MESGLILPPGVEVGPPMDLTGDPLPPGQGMVVNETDLPDELVLHGIETFFEEHASMLGTNQGNTFQSYSNQGSVLARAKFRAPANVWEEVALARDLADRDDDVASALGSMGAMAFGDGMRHLHPDEVTVALFDEIAKENNLDSVLAEVYRELLIASQVTTLTAFVTENLSFTPQGADRQRTRSVVTPLIGVIPAERIRVIGSDLLGTAVLAYRPPNGTQESWLAEYFATTTSPGRKAEMRREDPVLTSMVVGQVPTPREDRQDITGDYTDPCTGQFLYVLNRRMVHRSTFPKGAAKYPRPLLTRNFALLEAKRLLNLMDYALLQGGSNFLVVAKKGSDARPALPAEITNLRDTIKRASRTGVVIGDHRLNIEIITPNLTELLNPAKRNLLGRRIVGALLRIPEFTDPSEAGSQVAITNAEILSLVVQQDRRIVRRHIENYCYEETAKRNRSSFESGPPGIWFPKVILQGANFFTDYVLKLRDRGDISRHTAVQVAGFDYDAEVQSRKLEKKDDKVMTPAEVPFSKPGQPADNGGGRPVGGSPANGAPGSQPQRSTQDPARPTQVIQRNAGETVRAYVDDELGVVRVGNSTWALLEEYADSKSMGRITTHERNALERMANEPWPEQGFEAGPLTIIPVNPDEEIDDVKAVRLATGVSALVGQRADGAVMARALVFREPEFTVVNAQEKALGWGFLSASADAE